MAQRLLTERFQQLNGEGVFSGKRGNATPSIYDRAIDYASGVPDPGILPYAAIEEAVRGVLGGRDAFAALSYSDFSGIARLREHIARLRGVSPDNVFVTNGAMEGIYLAAQALVAPGDRVLLENPVFPEGKRIFELAGAQTESVAVGAHGVDLDELEERLLSGVRYKAFYTVPDFHNPTGAVTDGPSKSRLMELADRYGFSVVADNPYADLWFERPPAQFPQEYRNSKLDEHLIEIGSFSKILGPGWRIGWIIASASTVRALTSFRRSLDGHPSTFGQYVVSELLDDDAWFQDLLRRERALYAAKARALYTALRSAFGEGVCAEKPQGGYFLWARLPIEGNSSDADAAREFSRQNLLLVPGGSFISGWSPGSAALRVGQHIRLSFAHSPTDDLVKGVNRLHDAVDRLPATTHS